MNQQATKGSIYLQLIPEEIRQIIEEYIVERRKPKDFLHSVLSNDLSRTLQISTDSQRQFLLPLMDYIFECVPPHMWGSHEAIERHIDRPLIQKIQDSRDELKKIIVAILFDFTNKYASPGSILYPHVLPIMLDVLTESLHEVKAQQGTTND